MVNEYIKPYMIDIYNEIAEEFADNSMRSMEESVETLDKALQEAKQNENNKT